MVGGAYFETIINGTFSQQREESCRRIGNPINLDPLPIYTTPTRSGGALLVEPNRTNRTTKVGQHHTTPHHYLNASSSSHAMSYHERGSEKSRNETK